jgi:hypothetical protein
LQAAAMTSTAAGNAPADGFARAWLARSFDTTAAALRAMKRDDELRALPVVVRGLTPPAAPTEAELETAAATLARAATCLRHTLARRGAP